MKKYDVVAIGNPLLDLIVEVNDDLLEELGLKKGEMHLIDDENNKLILNKLKGLKGKIAPGGSGSNVADGVCKLGGSSFFMGSIGCDDHGKMYESLCKKAGIDTKFKLGKKWTGVSIILITPDFERTMATYLGACSEFKKGDIDEEVIRNSKILHLEGYFLETPDQLEASIHAMRIAKDAGVKVSIDLADSAFITRHFETVTDVVEKYADIVFANEREARAFTGEKNSFKAAQIINGMCDLVAVTLGKKGSLLMLNSELYEVECFDVEEVNTSGAGDMYDAGILFGISRGKDLESSSKIASYAAAQAVASTEARVQRSLAEEIEKL